MNKMTFQTAVTAALGETGFGIIDDGPCEERKLAEFILARGRELGSIQPGRFGQLVERIIPVEIEHAPQRSLSERFGRSALPFHCDAAHRLNPARLLILACADPGTTNCPTRLIDLYAIDWTDDEIKYLTGTVFLVRSGRRSFYSTVLDKRRPFFRYDPGCLEPINELGEITLSFIDERLRSLDSVSIPWKAGRILLIDNWRMAHARGPAQESSGRVLLRGAVSW